MTPLTNSIEETIYETIGAFLEQGNWSRSPKLFVPDLTQSIITKVKESLPEKKEGAYTDPYDNPDIRQGYNECLDDVKERLSL